jgi:AraC-like DNA-binding protein
MPFLDGHEFLRKVFSKGAFARYIIILGSDTENEAATLSRRGDVIAVLSKDQVDVPHLRTCIGKAQEELDKAMKDYQNIRYYEAVLQNSPEAAYIDRQTIYNELITGIIPEKKRLDLINSNPVESVFWIAIAEPVWNTDPDFTFYVYHTSIKSLEEEMCNRFQRYERMDIFIVSNKKLCIVIASDSVVSRAAESGTIEKLFPELNKLAELLNLPRLTFTFYNQAIGLQEFAHAYKVVNNFSKYRFFHYKQIILKTSQAKIDKIMCEDTLIRNLLIQAAVLTGEHDEGAIFPLLKDLGEKLRVAASFRIFNFAWNQLIFICNLEIQKQGLNGDEYVLNLMLNDYKTIDEAMEAMISCYHKLFDGIRRKLYRGNEYIEKALVYMTKNHTENISLEDVADKVYVSGAYLSRLFSKETGKSFTDNLHLIRITHARKLLADHKFQVSEVAYQVGFNDPKYFSQVFRKLTGSTPRGYKQQQNRGRQI